MALVGIVGWKKVRAAAPPVETAPHPARSLRGIPRDVRDGRGRFDGMYHVAPRRRHRERQASARRDLPRATGRDGVILATVSGGRRSRTVVWHRTAAALAVVAGCARGLVTADTTDTSDGTAPGGDATRADADVLRADTDVARPPGPDGAPLGDTGPAGTDVPRMDTTLPPADVFDAGGLDPNLVRPDPGGRPCTLPGYASGGCSSAEVCRLLSTTEGRCERCTGCGNLDAPCRATVDCDILFACYAGRCTNFCTLGTSECGPVDACLDVGHATRGVCRP
jgi:hypothetical protein